MQQNMNMMGGQQMQQFQDNQQQFVGGQPGKRLIINSYNTNMSNHQSMAGGSGMGGSKLGSNVGSNNVSMVISGMSGGISGNGFSGNNPHPFVTPQAS